MARRNKYQTTTHIWLAPSEIDRIATQMFGDQWRKPFCAFFEISYPNLHRIMTLEPGRGISKAMAMALVLIDKHGMPEMTQSAIADVDAVKRDPFFAGKVAKTVPDAGLDFGVDDESHAPIPETITEAQEAIAAASAKPAKAAAAKPGKAAPVKAKAPAKKPAKKKPVAA